MAKSKATRKADKKKPRRVPRGMGDSITIQDVSGDAVIAAGRGASASHSVVSQTFISDLAAWRAQMEQTIDRQPNLSVDDKEDLKQQIAKVEAEASKGEQSDPSRLEKLLNTLVVMGPDIWEVATTTLINPLGGIGLVLKKIGDKVKIERQASSTPKN